MTNRVSDHCMKATTDCSPSRRRPRFAMKHSATCNTIAPSPKRQQLAKSSVGVSKFSKLGSPSADNLSTANKTPYELLLEQIQRTRDSVSSTSTSCGRTLHSNRATVGKYTLHEVLGKGTFSKVQLATHQLTKGTGKFLSMSSF
ncbi:unnamed protein product [Mesocestoides corti]|uniref:Protein kinase domain-containing protein n=1 Tax=Mesocestoides corti TaxID=53468 RepID=A0A0R3UIH3_MESCO|nr:unnamed protein product [Mesocestoides corti]